MCGCQSEKTNMKEVKINFEDLKSVPYQNWEELASKKIYFGHQSVGFNIIDGIAEIIRELPSIKLNMQETNEPSNFNQPIFAHSKIGKNLNPIAKCDDFKRIMESGVGDKVDIAFFKFCYVDIDSESNIDEVFEYYANTISQLEQKYPRAIFVSFTVPLKSQSAGIKMFIKKLLRMAVDDGNINRNKFNQKLREKYAQQNTLFDLALYESRRLSEQGNLSTSNLVTYLRDEYTYDGGHLNQLGKKIIAKYLLLFLQSKAILSKGK